VATGLTVALPSSLRQVQITSAMVTIPDQKTRKRMRRLPADDQAREVSPEVKAFVARMMRPR
jgi:hypothetical protein